MQFVWIWPSLKLCRLVKGQWIVWCLKLFFLTFFKLYHDGQCIYPCFLEVLLTSTPYSILSSHWLLSHITIVKLMGSGERGMNPVAMTIINSRKEYTSWGLNQQPPVLKSYTQPPELWGSLLVGNGVMPVTNVFSLTLCHISTTFNDPEKESVIKHCRKRRKCL